MDTGGVTINVTATEAMRCTLRFIVADGSLKAYARCRGKLLFAESKCWRRREKSQLRRRWPVHTSAQSRLLVFGHFLFPDMCWHGEDLRNFGMQLCT